jgi:hypothetical protein
MPAVGSLKLHNTGAFVAKLGAQWIDPNGHTGEFTEGVDDIDEGMSRSLDPGTVGCPRGSAVWAYGRVVAGDDRHGSSQDGLIYEPGDPHVGEYHIHGTVRDTHMHFEGVEPPE